MTDKSEAEDVEPSKNKSQVDGSDEDVAVLYLLNLPQKSSRLKFTNIFKRAIKVDIINKRTLGVAEFRTGEAAAAGLREITSRELMIGGEKLTVSTKAPPMKGTYYDYNEKTKDPAFLYILNVPTGTKQEELGKLFQGVARVQIYGNLGIAEFKNGIAAATGLRKPSEKTIKGHKLVISIHRPKNANAIIRAVKSTTQVKPIDEDHQKPAEGEEKILAHNTNRRKSPEISPGENESKKSGPKKVSQQIENHKITPVENSTPPLSNIPDKNVKSKRNSSLKNHKDSNTKKSEKNSVEIPNKTKNSTSSSSDQDKNRGKENQKEEKKTSEDSSLKSNPPNQPPPPQNPSKRRKNYKSKSTLEDILVINVVTASGGGQNKRGGQPASSERSQDDNSEDQVAGIVSKWQRTHGGNRGISDWQRTV